MQPDPADLRKYLQSQHGMVLATVSSDHQPYACFVFYGFDDDWKLYFISSPATQHIKNIAGNSQVAIEVVDTHQQVTSKKVGVQLTGNARLLEMPQEIARAVEVWNTFNPGMENVITAEKISKNEIQSKPYEIQLISAKFFDEELYGPDGVGVFDLP